MGSRKTNTDARNRPGWIGSNLAKRVAVAIVFIPLFLLLLHAGGIPFLIFTEILILLAALEFYRISEAKGLSPRKLIGTLLGLAVGFAAFLSDNGQNSVSFVFFVGLFVIALAVMFDRRMGDQLKNYAITLLGVFYCGWLFSHQILLRKLTIPGPTADSFGWRIILYIYILTWILDTAAYFVGTRLGKHKLFPRISPHKTVEGAIGGMVFILVTALLLRSTLVRELSVGNTIVLSVVLGVVGQFGDLIESMFKRDAGIKDSSSFIPGHGGVLDRFDSLMFNLPATYYFLRYLSS